MEPGFKEDKFDFGVHVLKRRNFFNDRAVKEWVFTEYYSHYVDVLGDSLLKTVIANYKNDIQWLKSMKQLPNSVKNYLGMILQEISNLSLRDIQDSIDKKKVSQRPGIAINAPIYSTVTTIGSNNTEVTFKNDESSNDPNNIKRRHEDGQMDPTNKKQKTTTDENAHPENDDDDKDEQYDELSDGSASSIDSTMEREVEWSFWDSCRDILMSAEMNLEINQFSPHKHGVIVCGDKLLQTEENAIDPAVYTLVVKHMNSGNDFSIDRSVTFAEVEEYFTAVFGAEKSNMVDCARNPVPATDPKKRNFIADMTLSIFRDIYDSESNLKHSESMVNSTCLHPAIRFACQAVTKGKLLFYPGEERLNAMNMVLGDDTVIYRGDAIVRMRGALELEVLLLETSNALGACTESKKAFDFYKALYGGVAMLKSIANQFKYGDIKLFKRIKVYFLHASKEEVRLWSVQYVSRHIYVVCREDTAKMPYDYNDLPSDITYFIHFFWVLKLRLENTISSIESLITDHEKKKKNDIYGTLSASENLEIIVEPIPIRLTERVHINKVPNHPDSFS